MERGACPILDSHLLDEVKYLDEDGDNRSDGRITELFDVRKAH
jgi:hypothetical protein